MLDQCGRAGEAASARRLGGGAAATVARVLSAAVPAAYRADVSAEQSDRPAPNAVLRRLRCEAGMSQAELVEALRSAGWDSCDRRTCLPGRRQQRLGR